MNCQCVLIDSSDEDKAKRHRSTPKETSLAEQFNKKTPSAPQTLSTPTGAFQASTAPVYAGGLGTLFASYRHMTDSEEEEDEEKVKQTTPPGECYY